MSCCSTNNCNCHKSIKEAKEPNKDLSVGKVVAAIVIATIIGG